MPRAVASCWEICEMNAGPLSDWREFGNPNLEMRWVIKTSATAAAVSQAVGKASTHPEKVSTKTSR